jgi:hypothetical protein
MDTKLVTAMSRDVRSAIEKHGRELSEKEWVTAAIEAVGSELDGLEMRLGELDEEEG